MSSKATLHYLRRLCPARRKALGHLTVWEHVGGHLRECVTYGERQVVLRHEVRPNGLVTSVMGQNHSSIRH